MGLHDTLGPDLGTAQSLRAMNFAPKKSNCAQLTAEAFASHKFCNSDGDRKAYYESSQSVIKENRQNIGELRKEVKDLRVQKAKKLAVSIPTSRACM